MAAMFDGRWDENERRTKASISHSRNEMYNNSVQALQ